MNKALVILSILCLVLITSTAQAQYTQEKMSPAKAKATVAKALTEDVTNASKTLNAKIDYIATNYDDAELRALIRNYEKTNRKLAAREGKPYVPYDRRIDVQNPQKVKRYFRKRVDIIF